MFAQAIPVPDAPPGTALVLRAAGNDTLSCGFDGNSDFYGLGIRLGIYLQWITTLLAHLFFDEAIPGNLELNCVFLLAVSAATLVATRTGTVRPAECLVLLHLCFGFIFSILSIWGHRIDMKFSLAGSTFRLALATAISSYAAWFWFRGLELLTVDACPAFTFILVPKAVSDAISTFYQVQSSVVLGTYGFLLARELLTTFCFFIFCTIMSGVFAEFYVIVVQAVGPSDSHDHHLRRVLSTWAVMTVTVFWAYFNGQKSAGPYRPSLFAYISPVVDISIFVLWSTWQLLYLLVMGKSPPPGFTYPPLVTLRLFRRKPEQPKGPSKTQAVFERIHKIMVSTKVLFLLNLCCLTWAVIAIEITLHWNSVSGIYDVATTGQLIPFIIGIVSILRFFLAVTVHSTTQYVTNILLQLFDRQPRAESSEDETMRETHITHGDFAYPISQRHEAVFWNRIRPRRQSIGTDPEVSENRPDTNWRHFQTFTYDGKLINDFPGQEFELSLFNDHHVSVVNQTNHNFTNLKPAFSWMKGLRHGLGEPWGGPWEFDNAEYDQRTVITLLGDGTRSNFPDIIKRMWIKPRWEDSDLQPVHHPDRIATGPADHGRLGPDNLADLPPGRIHSYFFTSGPIHEQSPSELLRSASNDHASVEGRNASSTPTLKRLFVALRVLVSLSFIALSWIFSERRIIWAFEQYGRILAVSILGRLWQRVKIILQLEHETPSQSHSLHSTDEEVQASQDPPQEIPREGCDWGPHRKRLGATASDELERSHEPATSLQDHLERLYGILNLHLQAYELTSLSTALQSTKLLIDDLSQTRQEFVEGVMGLEQQHVRARTNWYECGRRFEAVDWEKLTDIEIHTVWEQLFDLEEVELHPEFR